MRDESWFQAAIVQLILSKRPEAALEQLSRHYAVEAPKIKVGMPKRSVRKVACYVHKTKTIYFSHMDALYNPRVVLHEFYHHLRCHMGKHLGTEKNAERFTDAFIQAYMFTLTVVDLREK